MNKLAAALALASCCALGCASDEFRLGPTGDFELCFASPPPTDELELHVIESDSITSFERGSFFRERSVSGQIVLQQDAGGGPGTYYVLVGKSGEGPWTAWRIEVGRWPKYWQWSDWQPAWKLFPAKDPKLALLDGDESGGEAPPDGGRQLRVRILAPPMTQEESKKYDEADKRKPPEQRSKPYNRADDPIPACGG